jgi:hypothetical protein
MSVNMMKGGKNAVRFIRVNGRVIPLKAGWYKPKMSAAAVRNKVVEAIAPGHLTGKNSFRRGGVEGYKNSWAESDLTTVTNMSIKDTHNTLAGVFKRSGFKPSTSGKQGMNKSGVHYSQYQSNDHYVELSGSHISVRNRAAKKKKGK